MASQEIQRSTLDVHAYLACTQRRQEFATSATTTSATTTSATPTTNTTPVQVDMQWVEQTSRAVHAKTQQLEQELKSYKNNLIKESIRVGCSVCVCGGGVSVCGGAHMESW